MRKWKLSENLHFQNYYLQLSVSHSSVLQPMVCFQNCKCLAERGTSLRVTTSQLKINPPDRKTHATTQWWRSINPLVLYHNPTSRLRLPKVIPFPLRRGGSPFPCETFCWACSERFSLQLKLRELFQWQLRFICASFLDGWCWVTLLALCCWFLRNLGAYPHPQTWATNLLLVRTESTKNQNSFPNFNPTIQFFHFWWVYFCAWNLKHHN